MSIFSSKNERVRFVKFGVVGIIGSVIDFGFFNLLTILFKLPSIPSSVISFTLAVVNNFILNRFWTFPGSRTTPVIRQLAQFSAVSLIGLLIRTPLFSWMESLLIPLAQKLVPNLLTPTIVGHNGALAVAIGVVMLWNYFANRIWTFRKIAATD
jgi:putative flippase GtrA